MRNPTMAELELINLFNIVFRKYAAEMAKKQCCLAHALLALYEVDFIDLHASKLQVGVLTGQVSTDEFRRQMLVIIEGLDKRLKKDAPTAPKITQFQAKSALA